MFKFLQANLNRCYQAQDLITQYIFEDKIDVCTIAEPAWKPNAPGWVASLDVLALLYHDPRFRPSMVYNQSFVAATTDLFTIVSVYISPNVGLSAFILLLHDIKELVRKLKNRIVICGDFNAHATHWGSRYTSRRGTLLNDVMSELDLRLANIGNSPTCVRPQGESIIDLTFSSPDLISEIGDWRVREDLESLADHLYISFSLYNRTMVTSHRKISMFNVNKYVRWNYDKLNLEDFTTSLE